MSPNVFFHFGIAIVGCRQIIRKARSTYLEKKPEDEPKQKNEHIWTTKNVQKSYIVTMTKIVSREKMCSASADMKNREWLK